jgi:CP family cyanate transporter-like MFS transporter
MHQLSGDHSRRADPPDSADLEFVDIEADTDSPPAPTRVQGRVGRILLGISLVLIAFNLRPVFSSLSAVLPEVMGGLAVSPATASLLTTLPVLCLGLFAPAAPALAARFGAERTILVLLLVLALGAGLRGLATLPSLLIGSVLAGGSIAVVNVLLPGLVKRDFPERAALMTGLFTMALCAGAAVAAAATVPVEMRLGSWPLALAIWGLPALAVAAIWTPAAVRSPPSPHGNVAQVRSLWREPIAWSVTLYMGLQSAIAYSVFGWFVPILRERGLDAETAGYVLSVSVVAQMAACLVLPGLAVRGRDQRAVAIGTVAISVLGLLGSMFGPLWAKWIFAVIGGFGQGGLIAVAMTLIILRSPDIRVAAHLSGMAQGVGYVLAASGPLLTGFIRDRTGGFSAAAFLFVAIGAAAGVAGWGAGRNRLIGVPGSSG